MKKLFLLFSFLFSIFSFQLSSQEAKFSGEAGSVWAAALRSENRGDFVLGNTYLNAKIDAFYEKSSVYAEGRVGFDEISDKAYYDFREIWLDYTSNFWGIRIGHQKTAWGKADGIDITNVICPSDMSTFYAMTDDDSKLAVDAIRLSLSGNQFTADAYWIPFFTPAALPVSISAMEEPEKNVRNGEYGLKLSGYFSALDLSLYGFYGWDDTPFLNYEINYEAENPPYPSLPDSLIVSGQYKRMTMIGADAAIPIKETVLRAEAAFFPQRHFQKTEGNTEQHKELSALIGLDWIPSGWTFTVQYYCDCLFADIASLEREYTYQHGATLSISKKFLNETLELNLSGLLGLNDFDSFISPSVSYSLSDQITLSTDAYIFLPGPERDGKYGKYKEFSCLAIEGKYNF